jgi:hypothetical protein
MLQQQIKQLARKVGREQIVLSAMPELAVQIVELCTRTRMRHHRRDGSIMLAVRRTSRWDRFYDILGVLNFALQLALVRRIPLCH